MYGLYCRKIVLYICCFLSLNYVFAQNLPNYDRKPVHFGITMAINSSGFKIYKDISFPQNDSINVVESVAGPGFNLGIISDLRLTEHLNLRFIPALSFAERSLKYLMIKDLEMKKTVESTYLDFPIQLKFKTDRINDCRFYTLGGFKYSVDMISNAKARRAEGRLKTGRHSFFVEYGTGLDFYFQYFKFSLEIKISNGMNNTMVPEPDKLYASVLEKLYPRTFLFSLHFE